MELKKGRAIRSEPAWDERSRTLQALAKCELEHSYVSCQHFEVGTPPGAVRRCTASGRATWTLQRKSSSGKAAPSRATAGLSRSEFEDALTVAPAGSRRYQTQRGFLRGCEWCVRVAKIATRGPSATDAHGLEEARRPLVMP